MYRAIREAQWRAKLGNELFGDLASHNASHMMEQDHNGLTAIIIAHVHVQALSTQRYPYRHHTVYQYQGSKLKSRPRPRGTEDVAMATRY